ncbi:transcriptional regulator ATRX [Tripterygium wilfordii]|uniref:transcriptional regulator ATRX n=1 Tax=Tripterygium wilfordii TaxID=458696 RepID=UPI0018F7E874|nr:transcriptional regulator ATRX [Tripterygium wilfordii]
MRLATKPISSPGRTEKFPPPLMRFLRTNVGSKSRGRSRSSPMFVLRKKSTVIEAQEPSSPKVTCMGQVRVRRSKQSGTNSSTRTRASRTNTSGRRRCKWIRNSLSCYFVNKKFKKPKSLKTVWRKWVLFFHVDFKGRRRSKTREDSPKIESRFGNKSEDLEQDDDREDIEEKASRVYASSSISSPPKNALLLTRSRSAPYRSSSLASRFWGSPLANEETEQQKQEEEEEQTEQDESREDENPTSNTESIGEDSGPNSRRDPEMDPNNILKFTDIDGAESESVRERFSSDARIEEVKSTEEVENARPWKLTRCKSEPARIAATLDPDPELSFWKKRRR